MKTAVDILNQVKTTVTQDRNRTHGDPMDQLGQTACFWSVYLGIPISREQVATCLQLQKISRSCHGEYNPDDDLDNLGYGLLKTMAAKLER